MKTAIKIICIILASLLTISLGALIYYLALTKDVKLDKNRLINMEKVITVYDCNNNLLFKEGDEKQVTEIKDIPLHVQNAFIAVEDKRFYKHNGVDTKGLFRAMLANIKSFSFKEGGSTISQQLIKNTHLSNQKTLKRKLSEIKLAKKLEKEFTKQEILEKYLNTIYFGDNCYGITNASRHYFGKEVQNLTINEGATLAGLIKAPSSYSPFVNAEKCNNRKNVVLAQMNKQGYINEKVYFENVNSRVETVEQDKNDNYYSFNYLVKNELNKLVKDYPFSTGNINVYTTIDINKQKIIEDKFTETTAECDKTAIIMDKNGQILGYFSSCGNIPRQVGSTIKPILVYAPAIENDVVYSCTPILDEKTVFNGYSPSNYNGKYYGYTSVKSSLAKSLNTCAVKILNYTGIEKSKAYLEKMNFPLTNNDNSLCLALGATEKGAKLTELLSCYTSFLNNGEYNSSFCINKVETQNNGVIYVKKPKQTKVFSEETTHIINDALQTTVKDGTAKKLSYTNIPLCAKTGTVGNENGNLDAYNISYNSEQIIGVWFGNKDNSLMDNSITGGTAPTILASQIWEDVYINKVPPTAYLKSNRVCEKYIDKIEYENNHSVLLASESTPMRYKQMELFKNNSLPKEAQTFITPQINFAKLNVLENMIEITFDIPEYYNAYIYKNYNGRNDLIYDTKSGDKKKFVDENIQLNTEYQYYIIPYLEQDNKIYKGKEVYLDKIKITSMKGNDKWWNDELD